MLTPEQIAQMDAITGLGSPTTASPTTTGRRTPEQISQRLNELRTSAKRFDEDESAESAGAILPAKTGESPLVAGGKALVNTPSSATNLAKNLFQLVRHPIQTLKAVGLTTTGSLDSLLEKYTGIDGDPESMQMARLVGTELKKRYGGPGDSLDTILQKLQRTATNDPFSFGTDVMTIMTGLAPIKTALKGTEIANVASRVGEKAKIPVEVVKAKAASLVEKSAQKAIGRVLEPKKETMKTQTMQILPELTTRKKVAFSRAGLEEKFSAELDAAGQAIDDTLAAMPEGTKVTIKPIIDSIEESKKNFVVKGTENKSVIPEQLSQVAEEAKKYKSAQEFADKEGYKYWMDIRRQGFNSLEDFYNQANVEPVIANMSAWKAADDLQKLILNISKDDKAPIESIRSLRQIWDKEVASSKGFSKDLKEGTALDIKKEATNAIRKQLASEFPDLAAVNKEYTLWKTADDILSETLRRRTGKEATLSTKGAGALGASSGYAAGGIKEAAMVGAIATMLAIGIRSTAWRTFSAAAKMKLAEAIYANKPREVQRILTPLLGEQVIDIETDATE